MTFKKALQKKELSRYAVAKETGLGYATIFRLYAGGRPNISTCIVLSTIGISTTIKNGKVNYN